MQAHESSQHENNDAIKDLRNDVSDSAAQALANVDIQTAMRAVHDRLNALGLIPDQRATLAAIIERVERELRAKVDPHLTPEHISTKETETAKLNSIRSTKSSADASTESSPHQ